MIVTCTTVLLLEIYNDINKILILIVVVVVVVVILITVNNCNKDYKANIHDSLFCESWKPKLKAHTAITTVTVDLDFGAYFVNYQAFRFLHLKVTGIILVSKIQTMSNK